MSSVAGQWHSSGNWLHELCGWPMAFLRQIELAMSYVAEENRLANDIPEEIGYMCWRVELGMSYVAG